MALAVLLKDRTGDANAELQSRLNGDQPMSAASSKLQDMHMESGGQAAYLGPQLWQEVNATNTPDGTLEFMDLDEFLQESGIMFDEGSQQPGEGHARKAPGHKTPSLAVALEGLGHQARGSSSGQHAPASPVSTGSSEQSWSGSLSPPSASRQHSHRRPPTLQMRGGRGGGGGGGGESSQISDSQYHTPASPPWETGMPGPGDRGIIRRQSPSCTVTKESLSRSSMEQLSSGQLSPIPSPLSPETPTSPNQTFPLGEAMSFSAMPGAEGDEFDPSLRTFSAEELRPLPIMKKSKKKFVLEENKDDRYWARRTKNNYAAKRSRDARRMKENQIAMRTAFLEDQNNKLAADLEVCRKESDELRARLAKYEADAAR